MRISVQLLEFAQMLFERVCGKVPVIEPIVSFVERNTMVVNFSSKVNQPLEIAISLVIIEFEFVGLHCPRHSSM